MFLKLLVAYDGSEGARKALRAGIELARLIGVDLYLISVQEDLPRYAGTLDELESVKEQRDAYFEELSREAVAIAEAEGVTLHPNVVAGHEVGSIVEYVRIHRFDLLLIGFHGHSRIYERVFGSTAHALAFNVPCSVLIVK